MGMLSKSSVLSADDFRYAVVPCPEWGGDMRVRGLTAAEQAMISKKVNAKQTDDIAVVVAIMGCVDDNGERFFDQSDRDTLKTKSYAVLDRLAKKILELSGNGEDGIEASRKN